MKWMRCWTVVSIVVWFGWAGAACARAQEDATSAEKVPTLAIRIADDSPLHARFENDAQVRAMREGRFGPLSLVVGPSASGDFVVEPYLFPGPPSLRGRLDSLPLAMDEETLHLDGQRYDRARHRLAFRLPGEGPPHWILLANDGESLVRLAIRTLFGRGHRIRDRRLEPIDFQLVDSTLVSRSGRWRAGEDGQFGIDPVGEIDEIARRDGSWASRVEIEGTRIVLRVPPDRADEPRLHALVKDLDALLARAASRIPLAPDTQSGADRIEVWIEDHYDFLGQFLGRVQPAVEHEHLGVDDVAGRIDLHAVPHPRDDFYLRFAVARLAVARADLLTGRPVLLDGAALWLTEDWYGRRYVDWIPQIAHGQVLPTVAQLESTEEHRDASVVLLAPAAAALIADRPGDTLRARLEGLDTVALESGLARLRSRAAAVPEPTAPRPWDEDFLRGVSLARSPGTGRGYESQGFGQVLDHLESIGVDAVSLIPMTGQTRFDQPGLSFMNRSPGDEHDIGMLFGARAAKKRGLSILWKPHVYVWGDSWPGDIEMTSDADWQAWWFHYRHFILYQTVLATYAGADLFAVGTELGKTLGHETEWRHLIDSVRRIFPGRVTYAGNWWADYDRIPFADQLDAVGVDAYFSLSHDSQASDADLVAGARVATAEMEAVSKRFGKPILLTEVGFSARKAAWASPHEEGDFRDPSVLSEEDQQRAYAALLGTLGRPPWLAGLYPWKVFSGGLPDPARGTSDFVFLGRPAEAVVRDYMLGRLPMPAGASATEDR